MSTRERDDAAPGCEGPLPWERLVDYWADDGDSAEIDAIDEHLFVCGACSDRSARVARIVQALRATIPAVVSAEQVAALRARGLVVVENIVSAGERREVGFEADVDILLHRLRGLDLSRAVRVKVTVSAESSGAILHEEHLAPFDPERGEVWIACQRHFSDMPPDIVFAVSSWEAGAIEPTDVRFAVPHTYLR